MAAFAEVPLVLVTGVSGFIGSHIAHKLLTDGHVRVRGTVRSLTNKEKVKPLQELVPDAKYPLEIVEAQLDNPDCWKEAVQGCSYVYHVASPVPLELPRDENEVIKPAVEGTLSVFKACAECGSIKRIVLTSSIVAVYGEATNNNIDHVFTEKDWSNVDEVEAYCKSKHLAEKAAWDFIDNLEPDNKIELVVCNPGLVIGPIVSPTSRNATSLALVQTILGRTYPFLLDLSFPIVDVRDVAAAHIAGMDKPHAAGNRYILYSGQSLFCKDVSDILAAEFGPQGYNIPTRVLPKACVWVLSLISGVVQRFYPQLGLMPKTSNDKMKSELEIEPHDIRKTVIDTAYSLIEHGVIPKTSGYRPPPS